MTLDSCVGKLDIFTNVCEKCDANQCPSPSIKETLYVIGVISNPIRFLRRYQLFHEFVERMKNIPQIKLITIELQQGEREYQTCADIKLKTTHEIWHKENLINIAISHLPDDWKYVAWIDTDIDFYNKNWAEETLHKLQHNDIVQLFSHAIDLGPNGESIGMYGGFVYHYTQNGCDPSKWTLQNQKYGCCWHPGYAWACNRKIFNLLGGMIDYAILGSGDHHMAMAFIGLVEKSVASGISKNYMDKLKEFQHRCDLYLKRNIGYVTGCILHHWHGRKTLRRYQERWEIITKNKFDPETDIYKDSQGLYQLTDQKPKLRDDIRLYFIARNEDSIDLE